MLKPFRFVLVVLALLAFFVTTAFAAMPTLRSQFGFTPSPDLLLNVFALVLAVAFDWFPGLAGWYDKLKTYAKKAVMIGLLLLIAAVIFAGTCYGFFVTGVVCSQPGAYQLIGYILVAIGVNQGVHLLSKPEKQG